MIDYSNWTALDAEAARRLNNYHSHRNIELVGEGELSYCTKCHGGEGDLFEMTCEERQKLNEEEK